MCQLIPQIYSNMTLWQFSLAVENKLCIMIYKD
jgi:hypothetical protein